MVHVDVTGKTTFTFRHTGDDKVFVVGDFSGWHLDHFPMRRVSEHEWVLMMRLPPGTYEFRYYAGGQWFTDYASFGVVLNRFGDWNSVLRVPKVRPALAPAARVRMRQVRTGQLVASA
jgi:hypothetical protein